MFTMSIDIVALRSQILAYLRDGVFSRFDASHVSDMQGSAQVWVTALANESTGSHARLIFDYARGFHTIEFIPEGTAGDAPFYAELRLLAEYWGGAVAENTERE